MDEWEFPLRIAVYDRGALIGEFDAPLDLTGLGDGPIDIVKTARTGRACLAEPLPKWVWFGSVDARNGQGI